MNTGQVMEIVGKVQKTAEKGKEAIKKAQQSAPNETGSVFETVNSAQQSSDISTPQCIEIVNVDNVTTIDNQIQKKADEKLNCIADKTIDAANKKISMIKTASICGSLLFAFGPVIKNLLNKNIQTGVLNGNSFAISKIGASTLGIVGVGILAASVLVNIFCKDKAKAGFSKFQAIKHEQAARMEDCLTTFDFTEKAGNLLFGRNSTEALTGNSLQKNAYKILGTNAREKSIYISLPKENDNETLNSITISAATIDSRKYDGLNMNGIEKEDYNIEQYYKGFIEKLTKEKNLSQEQYDNFIRIIKALSTNNNNIYKKSDENSKDDEDVDIFDLSGDGYINYGDIAALNLFIENDKINKISTLELSNATNWDFGELNSNRKINSELLKKYYDLNCDENIDSKDFDLFQKINKKKLDINKDNKVDEKDVSLMELYVKSLINKYKDKGAVTEAIKQIAGGEEKVRELMEHYEPESQSKAKSSAI